MSLLPEVAAETAHLWFKLANIVLIVAAFLVLAGTVVLFWSGNEIKRHDDVRLSANEAETARANASAAEADARAAEANAQAALLRLQLEQEIQKREPRSLTEEQRTVLLSEMQGKIREINVVVQRDVEAQAFAMQLYGVLSTAGAVIHPYQMPPGEVFAAPAGLLMYRPGGGKSEGELAEDPLYRALKKAGLFGGFADKPFLSPTLGGLLPGAPMLSPDQYILYVGQKLPW